jgi:hypothetical protein
MKGYPFRKLFIVHGVKNINPTYIINPYLYHPKMTKIGTFENKAQI